VSESERITDFTELKTWKRARQLRALTFRLTKQAQFNDDRGLRSQMRNAATSAMSNVGEGFEREGNKQFMQFLWVAKGSAGELRSQAYAALDSELLTVSEFKLLHATAISTSELLAGFIRYLKKSELRGSKYARQDGAPSRAIREGATTYAANVEEETAEENADPDHWFMLRDSGF
jgi:four helix bundle protein